MTSQRDVTSRHKKMCVSNARNPEFNVTFSTADFHIQSSSKHLYWTS